MPNHNSSTMDMSSSYRQGSSRSAYPTFIPLGETLLLHLNWARAGLVDAFRWDFAVKLVASDAEIRGNVLKSGLLNGLSLLSIWVFDWLMHFADKKHDKPEKGFVHANIGWFYQVLWLGPIVGVSLYLNSTWCNVIARRSFILQHGNRAVVSPQSGGYSGMLNSLATSAYRAVMVFTCVALSMALGWLPIPLLGPLLGFFFFCWVDAYYCFEFIWISRGFSLARRVRHIEERWGYYLAFGLPPAALCMWGSSLANAAMFALIFPYYIMMATRARPLPVDPYNPLPNDGNIVRHPSPFVPLRLPIFAIVIWLNDSIVKVLSVGTSGGSYSNKTGDTYSKRGEKGGSLDPEGIENIEEGANADALEPLGIPLTSGFGETSGRQRVKLSRKKLD